jgi:hypothetical protein
MRILLTRKALVKGFSSPSALFRHEIAFVLGQMQNASSAEALMTVMPAFGF